VDQLGKSIREHWPWLVAAIGSAVIIIWASALAWGTTSVGNAAEWAAAVGTVGTLAAAVWVASRDVAERERRQAALVFYRVERVGEPPADDPRRTVNTMRFTIHNGSPEPIYNVGVALIGEDGVGLAGSKSTAVTFPGEEPVTLAYLGSFDAGHTMVFTDSSGRGWQRDSDGGLRRQPMLDRSRADEHFFRWAGIGVAPPPEE
jgi:hypothetical protein